MGWVRRGSAVVGVLLLGVGSVVSLASEAFPEQVRDVLTDPPGVEPSHVVLGVVIAIGIYTLWRYATTDPAPVQRLVRDDRRMEYSRAGSRFDRAFEASRRAQTNTAQADYTGIESTEVQRSLRQSVVAVRTHDGSRTPDEVNEELDDGTWTDDRVVAAFLGRESAPDVSLSRRLYAWLYPERAYRSRVERTVDEIERQASILTSLPGDGGEDE
jgi:hypothetical protein